MLVIKLNLNNFKCHIELYIISFRMKLFNKHFTIGFGQQKIKHMVDGVHTCLNNISQLFFSDT